MGEYLLVKHSTLWVLCLKYRTLKTSVLDSVEINSNLLVVILLYVTSDVVHKHDSH